MTTEQNQEAVAPSPDEGIARLIEDLRFWADMVDQRQDHTPWEDGLISLLRQAEKHLAEAVATITALSQENEHLKQFGKYIQHLRTCPHFMAMRFQLEPGWIAVSHSKPCTCGLAEAIAKQSERL